MTWLAAWVVLSFVAGPLIGRYLKHRSPTDAPTGRIGDRP